MMPMIGQAFTGPSGINTLRLEKLLGSGAFGFVFAASDITTNETFAVKFPQVGVFSDQIEIQAFMNEVRAAAEIEHPNVVKVLFVNSDFSDGIMPYFVMEYVSTGTLKDVLAKQRNAASQVSPEQLRVWIDQLINGIEAINSKLLHRDLKPDNILFDNNQLKISDFGLSKVVGAATRSRTFKGGQHVLYMAPEGWRLETNNIQLDMYALGIVFFEMLTLQFPYDIPNSINMGDFDAVKSMHLFQTPKRIFNFRQDIPVGVDQVVQRMLAKRPQDRFTTWGEVRNALQGAWNASPRTSDARIQALTTTLLEGATQLHQKKVAAENERLRLERIEKEETQLDAWQVTQLISDLQEAVTAFNEQSALGSIRLQESASRAAWKTYVFDVPLTGAIQLLFFKLNPPMKFQRGSCRIFGHLRVDNGLGYNYLLLRKDNDDIYGQWFICKISISGLADPRKYPRRLEPFGFQNETEFREHMRYAEGVMHVYNYEWETSGQTQFLEIVAQFIKDRGGIR